MKIKLISEVKNEYQKWEHELDPYFASWKGNILNIWIPAKVDLDIINIKAIIATNKSTNYCHAIFLEESCSNEENDIKLSIEFPWRDELGHKLWDKSALFDI